MRVSPQELALRFSQSIEQQDAQLAERCTTTIGWQNVPSTPYHFFQQARRKRFQCIPQAEKVGEKRAYVLVEIHQGGSRKRSCYFLLLGEETQWLMAGVVARERQAELFLDEKIPAVLQVEELLSAPSAEQFLQQLWQDLKANLPVVKENYSESAWEAIAYFSQQLIGQQQSFQILYSYALPSLQRAGIDFIVQGAAPYERQSIVLERPHANASWQIVQRCLLIDGETLTAEPYVLSLP